MSNVFNKFGMAIVAILMIVGFSAFKVVEKKTETPVKIQSMDDQEYVIFRYVAPTVPNPYDDIHVKNLANWSSSLQEQCASPIEDQIPCSIVVPIENTTNAGLTLKSTVVIETAQTSMPGLYFHVVSSPNNDYVNERNADL